ncbi:CDP-diacylglycerol--serine O-phosphatidyltransferase [Prauserella sp. PE36]|uniref:CDP-diacylglycerol--serine O-phosphatidyltransferase n=1 Tax=Prauserella sp. PE36 TaxID=1504709 RepID=UPI000DA0B622|nr:CDP-diacylglycerol--serine O-phosphatidyltransferase [Prauserella sp. PE36]PXY37139.1 CDP-diacylglycerol--serine O-phosphatidyltransferase [Prauserella coralliicola]RBM10210.1 CDP-diacylglycerol--serine O-phosphatidyltransferase [Prauserella sp. PE36]
MATPGVRLLPNAITVLALCAGLSSVQFALVGNYVLAIGAIGVAAVLDSLDGRIARLLDATSKMGAELDSLSDAISFGVAPALVLYVWLPESSRFGWVAALIFAVCMVLRLARFNTLLDDTEQPPYASEFFVGVPAPAGGLLALMPVILTLEFGESWWSSEGVVWLWTVAVAGLLISRIPTLSLKKLRAPAKAVAPLLVGVGLLAAAIIQYPLIALASALLLYLAHIPYSVRRYHWLANHPEAWDVPPRERRAIRRARSQRRLGLRRPRFRRVAGAARRAVMRPRTPTTPPPHVPRVYAPDAAGRAPRRRNWRRIGLRQRGD